MNEQSERLRDITRRFYHGGRHEMLNETNSDEVRAHLLAWISTVVEAKKRRSDEQSFHETKSFQ